MNFINYQKSLFGETNIIPTVAVSTRRLNPNYTGFCLKVRRGSDSTQWDINFDDSGKIDESQLISISYNNSIYSTLYVSMFYSQGGGGNLISSQGFEPIILESIDSGNNYNVIKNINGFISLKFNSGKYLRSQFYSISYGLSELKFVTMIATNPGNNQNILSHSNNSTGNISLDSDYSIRSVSTTNISLQTISNVIPSSIETSVNNTDIWYIHMPSDNNYIIGDINYIKNGNDFIYKKHEQIQTYSILPSLPSSPYYLTIGGSSSLYNGLFTEMIFYINPLEYQSDYTRILHNQTEYYYPDNKYDII